MDEETTGASVAHRLAPLFERITTNSRGLAIRFWDGSVLGDPDAKATVTVNSPEALRHVVWAPGELGVTRAFVLGHLDLVGDAYHGLSQLLWVDPNLKSLGLRTAARTLRDIWGLGGLGKRPAIPVEEARPRGVVHSKRRDAEAISHHYDVSNEFYRLVLGPTMTYSCARFAEPDDSLDEAQSSKYDLVCRKLGLHAGMRMLDVGCGWGGLMIHAAKTYGVEAVGITLSNEQASLARERISSEGLEDRVKVRVQDYRDLTGERFDAISSIGMFEHVGHAKMSEYFSVLYSVLEPGGRLLNHAIDKPLGSIMDKNGFIARYVFPDGELQDLSVSISAMQDAGFEVRDVESLREHYAMTLRRWVSNLETHWDEAVQMVGRNRARVWWLYMLGSAVQFEYNKISIHQTIGVKTPENGASGMPSTRHDFV